MREEVELFDQPSNFGQDINTKFPPHVDECPMYIHANFQVTKFFTARKL